MFTRRIENGNGEREYFILKNPTVPVNNFFIILIIKIMYIRANLLLLISLLVSYSLLTGGKILK